MAESNATQVILTDDGIKIIKAQNTADSAAGDVDNLNDPNLMSVIEKQTAVAQYAGLTSQYNVILARAKDANISTTDLTTAYTNLNNFMTPILKDTTKASDVDRDTYNSLTDAYNTALSNVQTALSNNINTDIDNMQSSVSVASQAASSATIVASQAAVTGDNANQVASRAIVAANDAQSAGDNATSVANSAKSAADSTYTYANSEIAVQSNATAKAQSKADDAFSKATTAIDTGKVTSQAVTDLKDGSKLTIAELENGLATKVANSEYASYKEQTSNLIAEKVATKDFSTYKTQTADLISSKVATKDFSAYQATTAKAISSKVESSDFQALQTQVDNSAVGTNLLTNSNFSDESLTYWTVDTGVTSSFDSNGNLVLTVVNATANNRIYYSNQILDAGTTYAISFYAYVDSSSTSSSINVKVGPYQNLTSISVSGNTLTRYTGILNPVSGNSGILTIAVGTFNSGTVGDIVHITRIKLEKGSVATDWSLNPEDQATQSQFTQLSDDINLRVKKGDLVDQINIQAGNTLISSSGQLTLSGKSVVLDSVDPVIMKSANIGNLAVGTAQIANTAITDAKVDNVSANKLTAGTIDFNTITGTNINASNITTGTLSTDRLNVGKLSALSANLGDVTTGSLKGVDIVANTFSTPNGSFTTDSNGAITAKSMSLTDGKVSSSTISASTINGSTINGTTINTPTLNLGMNGTLTTDFNINQDTSLYGPKKGTGTLTIKTGVINYSSDNMSRYSNTAHYWYGFDDNGNVVKNGTNHTGDDYAPGYEKHDIMNSKGNVINRSYLDAMGLMFSEGGNSTYNTILTGVGLETATALLHKDLTTNGTFEAALGTDGTYGFTIGSKVIAPMVHANQVTYSANMFISRHGYMALSTSTKANKLDIVDVPDMLQKGYNLLTLNPRQWFDKTSVEAYADVQSGNSDSIESVVDIKPVTGMVAEEVASAGLDDYVIKDENNKVQGLAYDRLWTLLLPVLRDMNDKINKLQKKEGI